jgi:hypothetical protein
MSFFNRDDMKNPDSRTPEPGDRITGAVMDESARHDLANQLGIVVGLSEMLLEQSHRDDPIRADLEEIYKAARAALAVLKRAGTNPQ